LNGEWVSRFEVNISGGVVLGWSFVFGAEAADVAWSSKALVVSFPIIVWLSDCLLFSVVVSEVPTVALVPELGVGRARHLSALLFPVHLLRTRPASVAGVM